MKSASLLVAALALGGMLSPAPVLGAGPATVRSAASRPAGPRSVSAPSSFTLLAAPADTGYDLSLLKPITLTRQVMYQGKQIAEQTSTLTREKQGGRDVFHAASTITGMINQTQDVVFDARTFEPVSAKITGPVSLNLALKGGRIQGRVVAMGDTAVVNVTYRPGMLLPGMDAFAIETASLVPGQSLRLPMVSARGDSATTVDVQVASDTTITVPGGTFEVYRLELGAPQPATLFVRKKAPHIVVEQDSKVQPVKIVLKGLK